jgi:hypothetical protein
LNLFGRIIPARAIASAVYSQVVIREGLTPSSMGDYVANRKLVLSYLATTQVTASVSFTKDSLAFPATGALARRPEE